MNHDFLRPYFEAVKKISDGHPVKELDEIRLRCNDQFLKSMSSTLREQTRGYDPGVVIMAFVADAENKILMGADPVEAYSCVGQLEPVDLRRRVRVVLETVDQYLR